MPGASCKPRSVQAAAQRSGRPRASLPEVAHGPVEPLLKRRGWSMHADQTEKEALDNYTLRRAHIEAHKEATLEIAEVQAAKMNAQDGDKKKHLSVAAIVKAKNLALPPDVKPLAPSTLSRAVADGKAGLSPVKTGRPSLVLTSLTVAAHTWVGVQQQTQVPKPAEVRQHLAAAVKGTAHEKGVRASSPCIWSLIENLRPLLACSLPYGTSISGLRF